MQYNEINSTASMACNNNMLWCSWLSHQSTGFYPFKLYPQDTAKSFSINKEGSILSSEFKMLYIASTPRVGILDNPRVLHNLLEREPFGGVLH